MNNHEANKTFEKSKSEKLKALETCILDLVATISTQTPKKDQITSPNMNDHETSKATVKYESKYSETVEKLNTLGIYVSDLITTIPTLSATKRNDLEITGIIEDIYESKNCISKIVNFTSKIPATMKSSLKRRPFATLSAITQL